MVSFSSAKSLSGAAYLVLKLLATGSLSYSVHSNQRDSVSRLSFATGLVATTIVPRIADHQLRTQQNKSLNHRKNHNALLLTTTEPCRPLRHTSPRN